MELLFFVSDFHFGRRTAGWDAKTASRTLTTIAGKVHSLIQTYKPDNVFVLFLGDIMDGEAVYPEQAYELELLGFEQVYEGAHIFLENFLIPLASVCRLTIDGVPGNHAYLRVAHRKTNLDAFFYATVEQGLRERRVKVHSRFFTREFNDSLEVKLSRCGKFNVLIGHGHFLRSVAENPATSAQRRVLAWFSSYSAAGISIDLAAFGHFHRFSLFAVPGGRWILLNGCMLAYDEYGLTRYGNHGDRVWCALVVEDKKLLAVHPITDERLNSNRKPKIASPWRETDLSEVQRRQNNQAQNNSDRKSR
jgi:hypothetical protein